MKKRFLIIVMPLICLFNTYATSISDNNGAAFITKAEFDALKSSFQSQIDIYNLNIDSKIDNAISSYLSGIRIVKKAELNSELNMVKANSTLGTEYKFGKNWGTHTTKEPTGIWSGYLYQSWGQGRFINSVTDFHLDQVGAIIMGNSASIGWGSLLLCPKTSSGYNTNWNAYNPLICFETNRIVSNGVTYRTLGSYKLFENRYCYEGFQSMYHWRYGINKDALVGDEWTIDIDVASYSDTDPVTHTLPWNKCSYTRKLTVANATRDPLHYDGVWQSSHDFNCDFRSYYNQTFTVKSDLGYCVDTLNENIRVVDMDTWATAWWDDGTDSAYTHIGTGGFFDSNDNNRGSYCIGGDRKYFNLSGTKFKIPVVIHKSYKLNVDTLVNQPAMKSRYDSTKPVYFYNGLPLCRCSMDGVLTIKLKSKATKIATGADDTSATYSGTLYLDTKPFGKSTTKSDVLNENGTAHTAGWTFSNTNKNQTIKIKVKEGDEIWMKYNVSSITSGDLIEFETDADKGLIIENQE